MITPAPRGRKRQPRPSRRQFHLLTSLAPLVLQFLLVHHTLLTSADRSGVLRVRRDRHRLLVPRLGWLIFPHELARKPAIVVDTCKLVGLDLWVQLRSLDGCREVFGGIREIASLEH